MGGGEGLDIEKPMLFYLFIYLLYFIVHNVTKTCDTDKKTYKLQMSKKYKSQLAIRKRQRGVGGERREW